MLGGRAITRNLYPLSYMEIQGSFALDQFLRFGGLPNVFLAESVELKRDLLASYLTTYVNDGVRCMPWQAFVESLHAGELF